MSAPDMPHVQYALQANGDVNTLLSWLGVDTASEGTATDGAGAAATTPPVDQMPHLQLALQSNGDVNTLMSSLGHDLTSEQAASESQ